MLVLTLQCPLEGILANHMTGWSWPVTDTHPANPNVRRRGEADVWRHRAYG